MMIQLTKQNYPSSGFLQKDIVWPVMPLARLIPGRQKTLRREARDLKEVVAEQTLELRVLK